MEYTLNSYVDRDKQLDSLSRTELMALQQLCYRYYDLIGSRLTAEELQQNAAYYQWLNELALNERFETAGIDSIRAEYLPALDGYGFVIQNQLARLKSHIDTSYSRQALNTLSQLKRSWTISIETAILKIKQSGHVVSPLSEPAIVVFRVRKAPPLYDVVNYSFKHIIDTFVLYRLIKDDSIRQLSFGCIDTTMSPRSKPITEIYLVPVRHYKTVVDHLLTSEQALF